MGLFLDIFLQLKDTDQNPLSKVFEPMMSLCKGSTFARNLSSNAWLDENVIVKRKLFIPSFF